ncbi:toll/interleukin-1 receptor domain-containing protein [Alteromonas sp. H39]|uniref:toll/interleukin-1 receptor domain-containing protein n=1 Tax=Alteromonas sp. H39 TaxID=3389876 RepID=UPI0039DFBEB5
MASQPENASPDWRYRAFISYSHKDKAIALWLHRELERYRIPSKLVGTQTTLGKVPQKLSPIFRDQDELPASGNLGQELHDALANSLCLIVICSPAAAQSRWVNEEIRQFKMIHGADNVLAFIVDGEPNSRPEMTDAECFRQHSGLPLLTTVINLRLSANQLPPMFAKPPTEGGWPN